MLLTFEQFQATRQWHKDLSETRLSDASLEGVSGYTYADTLFIETPSNSESAPYHLALYRDEWTSDNLAELEAELYAFGCVEGHCEITPKDLARRFEETLRSWMTADEWQEMRLRNASEVNKNVCHSHDYCDANMAMSEAWASFGLPDCNADNETQAKLWNDAWNIFKTKAR